MSDKKHLVSLFISSVLAAFALGVLLSLRANAQVMSAPVREDQFPNISDIWTMRLDNANFTTVGVPGGTTSGFLFHVAKDASGRLPVVTSFLSRSCAPSGGTAYLGDGSYELWQQGSNGSYRRVFFQNSSHPIYTQAGVNQNSSINPEPDRSLGQGLPLPVGNYLFVLPDGVNGRSVPDWSNDTALMGYLAKP